MTEQQASHDMSIHVHDVGDVIKARAFAEYLEAWGCTPLRPIYKTVGTGKAGEFKQVKNPELTTWILLKEADGYQETWEAHEREGLQVLSLRRTA